MASFQIDGPIEITPELAMLLFKSLPESGQAGAALFFANRLMFGPLSDDAVRQAARVYAERMEIDKEGARALREAVAEKCRNLGSQSVNQQAVDKLISEALKIACEEYCREKIGEIVAGIRADLLVPIVEPVMQGLIGGLANRYFTQTQEGQQWVLDVIKRAKVAAEKDFVTTAKEKGKEAVAGRNR